MTKSKLTLAVAITTAMLTSSAFAASFDRNETIFQPNSPAATGAGSVGYNASQQASDGN